MKFEVDYSVIRSNRKTVSISVRPNREVVVRAPKRAKDADLEKIINEKKKWILNKLKKYEVNPKHPFPEIIAANQKIQIFGDEFTLVIRTEKSRNYRFHKHEDILEITVPINLDISNQNKIRKKLILWLKGMLLNYIEGKLDEINFTAEPNSIKIREYKSRWGSTTNETKISFNWKLVLMPTWIIDYVIIHEVCHLREMNHSKKYWSHVAKSYPSYREAKDWLKDNGYLYRL